MQEWVATVLDSGIPEALPPILSHTMQLCSVGFELDDRHNPPKRPAEFAEMVQ